jgi:hypothetical protein
VAYDSVVVEVSAQLLAHGCHDGFDGAVPVFFDPFRVASYGSQQSLGVPFQIKRGRLLQIE